MQVVLWNENRENKPVGDADNNAASVASFENIYILWFLQSESKQLLKSKLGSAEGVKKPWFVILGEVHSTSYESQGIQVNGISSDLEKEKPTIAEAYT